MRIDQRRLRIASFRLFEFNVVAFRQCNNLRGLSFAHCYTDDILIALKNTDVHGRQLRVIFKHFSFRAGMY